MVDMLSSCKSQKVKYWANHSWRWGSGDPTGDSSVSGGLHRGGGGAHHNSSTVTQHRTLLTKESLLHLGVESFDLI